jgi:hypothetical protein
MTLTGVREITLRKVCPSATIPTTNSSLSGLEVSLGLRGDRLVTNRLVPSECTVQFCYNAIVAFL